MPLGKHLNRREFGKVALGGALGAAIAGWPELSSASPAALLPEPLGIHLSCNAPVNPTDQDILFFKQLGLDTIYVRGTRPQDQTVEGLRALKKRYNDAGLRLTDVDNPAVDEWLNEIVINLPGRDKAIEAFKSWIRTLGEQVSILSDVIGRKLECIDLSEEEAVQAMVRSGLSQFLASAVVESFRDIRQGQAAPTFDTVEKVTARKPVAFRTWVEQNASRFA